MTNNQNNSRSTRKGRRETLRSALRSLPNAGCPAAEFRSRAAPEQQQCHLQQASNGGKASLQSLVRLVWAGPPEIVAVVPGAAILSVLVCWRVWEPTSTQVAATPATGLCRLFQCSSFLQKSTGTRCLRCRAGNPSAISAINEPSPVQNSRHQVRPSRLVYPR